MPDVCIEDCVLWTGAVSNGYGNAWRGGTWWLIHRWTWVQAHGSLPDGWQVHHRCHNRLCYNVAHLEAMPQGEHLRRHYEQAGPQGAAAIHAAKELCANGHPFDKVTARQRVCSICEKEAKRRYEAKRRTGRPRGKTYAAENKTTCANGHPFDGNNDKQRICSICKREARRRYEARKKEERRARSSSP